MKAVKKEKIHWMLVISSFFYCTTFAEENFIYSINEVCRARVLWECANARADPYRQPFPNGQGNPESYLSVCDHPRNPDIASRCQVRTVVPNPAEIREMTEALRKSTELKVNEMLEKQTQNFLELLNALREKDPAVKTKE
jgi:hypothetical protein